MTNFFECGSVITVLHDIADIGTNFTKFFGETKLNNFTGASFVFYMGVWFYTRIFVLPQLIYGIWVYAPVHPDIEMNFLVPGFCYLLFMMFMLHCYWFMMMVDLLKKFMKTRTTEDTQQKTEIVELPQKKNN